MLRIVCISKIQNAVITGLEPYYEGSITIPDDILKAARLYPWEQVHVLNLNNGERFITYIIKGEKKGEIILNGPAARKGIVGDKLFILGYSLMEEKELEAYSPRIVILNENNQIKEIRN